MELEICDLEFPREARLHIRVELRLLICRAELLAGESAEALLPFLRGFPEAHVIPQSLHEAGLLHLLLEARDETLIALGAFLDGVNSHRWS